MNSKTPTKKIVQNVEKLPIGDYSTPLSFSKIIYDTAIRTSIEELFERLDGTTVTDVVLVGIGGSHFGVQAVYDALYANEYARPPVRFNALTSIDTYSLDSFATWYTAALADSSKRVMTFVVSKTGATFETAAHASLCFELVKKMKPHDYKKNFCVVTDQDSPLWHASLKQGLETVPIPKHIGGRYSVFSAAGLAVMRFLAIDLQELIAGAQSAAITEPLVTAQELFTAFNNGYIVHDTFIFMPHYAALGGWTRQLIGESLGKQQKGFLPTVSLGSQDLHSVVQQYFGGKQFTITTFLVPAAYKDTTVIPETLFSNVGKLHSGLTFSDIQRAIIEGVQRSYQQAEKPFFTFTFNHGSAFDIGRYMQYKMLETVYLGTLMQINPFDQPQVELYKKETRILLEKE